MRDVASHQQPDSQRHEHCCQECDRPNMEGTVIRGWAPRLGDTDDENPPRRALARSRATGPGSAPHERFINGRALRHGLAGHDTGAALVIYGDLAVD